MIDLRTLEKRLEDPEDPNSKVVMRVPLPGTTVRIFENGTLIDSIQADQYGLHSVTAKKSADYQFLVSKNGYFNNRTSLSTADIIIDSSKFVQRVDVSVLLDKIFYEKEIVLENIYYDLAKWDIRDDAKPTLDSLASLLQINPDIRIRLGSHTDCRADDDYNLDLSQKRANSAVEYLVAKGIPIVRLEAKGFGETSFAVNCLCEECTEEEHQRNRRTTFAVVQ